MNLTNIVVGIIDACIQLYNIILRKPFLTVNKVQYSPQRDSSGKVTEELIAFTIANESCDEIEVQRIWFLTSFNRPIFSKVIDSKVPLKMLVNDRATYLVPIEELKAPLNKNVGETITEVVVLDKTEHQNIGRVDRVAQEELAR